MGAMDRRKLAKRVYRPNRADANSPRANSGSRTGSGLQVEDTGKGALTVVLLHGYGGSGRTWERWIPELSKSHRILNIDLPGFGRSPPPPDGDYSPWGHARAVLAALSERQDVGDVVLVGHSLGGGVALLMALLMGDAVREQARGSGSPDPGRRPRLRGMVLISGTAYPVGERPFMKIVKLGPLARALLRVVPKRAMVRWTLRQVRSRAHPPSPGEVADYAAAFRSAAHRRTCVETALEIEPDDMDRIIDRYPSIRVPAALIWGAEDPVVPLWAGERLQADLPEATLTVLDPCGHFPQDERPRESLEVALRFLARLEDQGAAGVPPPDP